tara:strand:+ start:272 stop:442 length:171 start_codon:yes stop_codon:yes gene_type:complete
MASDQLWVVAACFNESLLITQFIEQVLAQPDANHLQLHEGTGDFRLLSAPVVAAVP